MKQIKIPMNPVIQELLELNDDEASLLSKLKFPSPDSLEDIHRKFKGKAFAILQDASLAYIDEVKRAMDEFGFIKADIPMLNRKSFGNGRKFVEIISYKGNVIIIGMVEIKDTGISITIKKATVSSTIH